MTAQDAFDAMAKEGIWPFLKGRGFKRTKSTFHRPVGENWEVINLQKNRYSDRENLSFTVNLAVAIDDLREGVFDWRPGSRPAESRCQLRERLGLVMSQRDVWWEMAPQTDTGSLADVIKQALELFGIPWLEDRSSLEALQRLASDPAWLSNERWHHLPWYAKWFEQVGRDDLYQAVEVERQRKEAELNRARPGR